MATTIRKPEWAGCELRIVPMQLPHRFSFKAAGHKKEVHVTLTDRGAMLDKVLEKSEIAVSMALPANRFKGIAARAIDDGMGNSTVTLELHHSDIDLCIPLLVDTQLHNIAGDWKAWSEAYNIPMLMVEADGIARPLDEDMAQTCSTPQTRAKPVIGSSEPRRHSTIKDRRPRFLVRRKTGHIGCRMKISGREIIART